MAERLVSRPKIAGSQPCSLDEALVEFSASLLARGHPPSTVVGYTSAARHLVRWLQEHHRGIRSLTKSTVKGFFLNHLPACKCPAPAPRDSKTMRGSKARNDPCDSRFDSELLTVVAAPRACRRSPRLRGAPYSAVATDRNS
jgi:hypothetical protein